MKLAVRENGFTGSACRRWLAAMLLLSACWLASASSVRAECGDYVMIGHPAAADRHDDRTAQGLAHFPQPTRPKPCSGFSCSHRPMTPLPVPSTERPSSEHEWGSLASLDPCLAPFARTLLANTSPINTHHSPADIFHPPRG